MVAAVMGMVAVVAMVAMVVPGADNQVDAIVCQPAGSITADVTAKKEK